MLYGRLLEMFREENAQAVERIRQHWQAGRADEARRLAHTLKGLAATIGANQLAAAARGLEDALVREQPQEIETGLQQAQTCLVEPAWGYRWPANHSTIRAEQSPAP